MGAATTPIGRNAHRDLHEGMAGGVLDDDAADIALVNEFLDFVDQFVGLHFEFVECT